MKGKKIVVNVNELETILQSYHNSDCWNEIINWFDQFGKNIDERAKFLKAFLYTSKPLTSADDQGKAGDFSVLQGDIIKTKAAITNNPLFDFNPVEYSYYLVVPSSCSVQPNRYKQVLLARLSPIESTDGQMRNVFLQSIRFENVKTFYLPPIDGEKVGEFGFVAVFEEISYIENELLQSAQRLASLSMIGWHLLNAFLVNHFTRPSSGDAVLRQSSHDAEWNFYE
jgi:hypothetical protein